MNERVAKDAQQSTIWNIDRLNHCRRIAQGFEPDVPRDADWFRVSRHAAGVASAYVTQNDLRKRFRGQLETKVVNRVDDPTTAWNAEIWVRRA